MNNQQLIIQIEQEIQSIQENIQNWKEIIQQHERALLSLTQQLEIIKTQINRTN